MPRFLSTSVVCMLAFRAAVEDKTVPDLAKSLLVQPQLFHTSGMSSDEQNEFPLDYVLCHIARRFLIWCCELYSQVCCITELWS